MDMRRWEACAEGERVGRSINYSRRTRVMSPWRQARCRCLRTPPGDALIRSVSLHRLPVVFTTYVSDVAQSASPSVRYGYWLRMVHPVGIMSTVSVARSADGRTNSDQVATVMVA